MKFNFTFKKLQTLITVFIIFIVVEMVIATTIIAQTNARKAIIQEIDQFLSLEAETIAAEAKQIVTFRYRQLNMLNGVE